MPSKEYESKLASQRAYLVDYIKRCAQECVAIEKENRRAKNNMNWSYFHGEVDWSHKRPEERDLCVHLHKAGIAAERQRAKLKKNLVNYDKWLTVEREYENPEALLTASASRSILMKQFTKCDAKSSLSDSFLNGILESRMTIKVGGKYVTKPRYVSKAGKLVKEEKKIWQLQLTPLLFEQFLPDVINAPDERLYVIEECLVDRYKVLAMSSENGSDPDKPFIESEVKELGKTPIRESDEALKKAENQPFKTEQAIKERNQVLLQNFFGTVLNDDGSIFEWENEDGKKMPLENIVCVVGNENCVLVDPKRNTRASARPPFVDCMLLRSPRNGAKAIMDAGVTVNKAEDELFSLMLIGSIKEAQNITWYNENVIADKDKLSGGLKDGDSIPVQGPPGMAAPMGVIKTGQVPQDAFMMQNTLDRVFAENVLSNQPDLGQISASKKLATEMVQAGSSIDDVDESITSDIEEVFIERLAEECLLECIQHIDEMDKEEVLSCWGDDRGRGEAFLALSPAEQIAQCLGAFNFRGKGLKGLIANVGKAQALINLVSTITANPITFQAVESQVSAAKIIQQIAKNMGVDIEEISLDPQERALIEQKQLISHQMNAAAQVMQGGGPAQQNPGNASQGSMPGSPSGNGQGAM